jgi:putative glutamine amidotransferase
MGGVPVIGVTCGKTNKEGSPDRVGIDPEYTQALESAGARVVLLPPGKDTAPAIGAILDRLDGVMIPGGADIDPSFYGEKKLPAVSYTDPERDNYEIKVIRSAYTRGMPILGICRGQQSINVALGGTLYQDLDSQYGAKLKHQMEHGPDHNKLVHTVDIETGSRYRDATRKGRVKVNSRHHQAVRDVARGLHVTALSSDGVIEGLETEDRRVVAVQCHPEALPRLDWARRIFRDFVADVRRG